MENTSEQKQQPNQVDPAYMDALLSSLTDQRNAALNENVILAAGNKQLLNQAQQMQALIEALKAENSELKASKEIPLPPSPEV